MPVLSAPPPSAPCLLGFVVTILYTEREYYTQREKSTFEKMCYYKKMDWPVRSHFNRNMSLVVVRKTYTLIKVLKDVQTHSLPYSSRNSRSICTYSHTTTTPSRRHRLRPSWSLNLRYVKTAECVKGTTADDTFWQKCDLTGHPGHFENARRVVLRI